MDPQKLIIMATVAPSWIYPDAKNKAKTPEDAVDEVVQAWKAGETRRTIGVLNS